MPYRIRPEDRIHIGDFRDRPLSPHGPELQRILTELTRRAVEFNRTATTAKVANCFLWENLQGNRKAAVEGWLARGELECDKEVQGALQVLDELRAVPARAGGASSMAAEG